MSNPALLAPDEVAAGKYGAHDGQIASGRFRHNENTQFPCTIMHGGENFSSVTWSIKNISQQATVFHLICHDIFDTQEWMKIFLQPIVSRFPGMQVLLWNYPDQAFTEFQMTKR